MWLLVIMLAVPGLGFRNEQVLHQYATLAACQAERDRISREMEAAYPEADNFKIACLYRVPGTRKWSM